MTDVSTNTRAIDNICEQLKDDNALRDCIAIAIARWVFDDRFPERKEQTVNHMALADAVVHYLKNREKDSVHGYEIVREVIKIQ